MCAQCLLLWKRFVYLRSAGHLPHVIVSFLQLFCPMSLFKYPLSASYLFPFLSFLLFSPSCPPFPPPSLPFSLLSPPGCRPWLLHFSDMQFPEVKVQVQKIAHRTNTQLWGREHHRGKWHDGIALCSSGEQKEVIKVIKRDIEMI